MAREARKRSKSGMYIIAFRGEELFKSDKDKSVFLELTEKYFEDGEIYGSNLSKTEARLVVKEAPKGISMTVKPLTTSYARYFNRTHNQTGKLFDGRFKSIPIESNEEKEEALKNIKSKKVLGTVKPKREIKDTKPVKEEVKPEPKEEKPKPKKRNQMPSYLL